MIGLEDSKSSYAISLPQNIGHPFEIYGVSFNILASKLSHVPYNPTERGGGGGGGGGRVS